RSRSSRTCLGSCQPRHDRPCHRRQQTIHTRGPVLTTDRRSFVFVVVVHHHYDIRLTCCVQWRPSIDRWITNKNNRESKKAQTEPETKHPPAFLGPTTWTVLTSGPHHLAK
ncbi:unnamed protein product, partial [Ectocarpus sp. 6 AP-2014]